MTQNSKTGASGCCVAPQEGKIVRRACRAAASLEKKVRELEKFRHSALSHDQKTGFLRQLTNDDLEQFLSHLSATGSQTYETLPCVCRVTDRPQAYGTELPPR